MDLGGLSQHVFGREETDCLLSSLFQGIFFHSVGEGKNANFLGSGTARDEHPSPLLFPDEKPPLPVHLKPCLPSSFPGDGKVHTNCL